VPQNSSGSAGVAVPVPAGSPPGPPGCPERPQRRTVPSHDRHPCRPVRQPANRMTSLPQIRVPHLGTSGRDDRRTDSSNRCRDAIARLAEPAVTYGQRILPPPANRHRTETAWIIATRHRHREHPLSRGRLDRLTSTARNSAELPGTSVKGLRHLEFPPTWRSWLQNWLLVAQAILVKQQKLQNTTGTK
jgi:hypothetical protein